MWIINVVGCFWVEVFQVPKVLIVKAELLKLLIRTSWPHVHVGRIMCYLIAPVGESNLPVVLQESLVPQALTALVKVHDEELEGPIVWNSLLFYDTRLQPLSLCPCCPWSFTLSSMRNFSELFLPFWWLVFSVHFLFLQAYFSSLLPFPLCLLTCLLLI